MLRWRGVVRALVCVCWLMVLRTSAQPSCRSCARWWFEGDRSATECDECEPGTEPNPARNGCQPCQGNFFSDDGGPCRGCADGTIHNADRDGCDPCPIGQYADKDSEVCSFCEAGTQPNSASMGCDPCYDEAVVAEYYSQRGELEQVDARILEQGNLVSLGMGQMCTRCYPGQQPNDDWSECETCPAGRFSEHGCDCEACERGMVPSADSQSCEWCDEGRYSAHDSSSCEACEPGKQVELDQGGCVECRLYDAYENNLVSPDGTDCEACESGKMPNAAHTACESCPDDTVSLYGTNCTSCEPGQYANGMNTDCMVCPKGKYAVDDPSTGRPCGECIGRTYSNDDEGQDSCSVCEPGTYAARYDGLTEQFYNVATEGTGEGNVRCAQCEIGQYTSDNDFTCQRCPAGQEPHLEEGGRASGCDACANIDPSTHSPDGMGCVACYGSSSGEIPATSATHCHCPGAGWSSASGSMEGQSARYPVGSYDYNMMGEVHAFVVQPGSTTRVSSDINLATCLAADGRFLNGSCCQACPSGVSTTTGNQISAMNCTDGSDPTINRGVWWREGASDAERRESQVRHLFFCPNSEACLATGPGDQGCAPGYHGALCAACSPGYAKYSANTCVQCPDSGFVRVLIGAAFILIITAALGYMVRKNNHSIAPPTVDDVLTGYKKDSELIIVTLKIGTSFLQVQAFCAQLDLSWPGAQDTLFTFQSSVSEASSTMKFAACMLESDETPFVLSTAKFFVLLPFLIIAGVAIVYLLIGAAAWHTSRKRRYRVSAAAVSEDEPAERNQQIKIPTVVQEETEQSHRAKSSNCQNLFDEGFSAVIVLLCLIYSSVWKQILVVFSCFTVDEEDGTLPRLEVMQADVGVECAGDVYLTVQAYAIITGIVIGLGLPLVSWCQMSHFYKTKQMHTDHCRKRYGFMFNGYERPLYFWELVIIARKVCIVIAQMAVRKFGARMQALVTLLIMVIASCLNIVYKPFIYRQHDVLETLSLVTSALTLLSGLIYDCLADQGEDTESLGALLVFVVVCAINIVTVIYAAYVVVTTMAESAKYKRMHKDEDEQRKAFVRGISTDGRLKKKALHEKQVQDKWAEMVDKQQKYAEAERIVETTKVSLGRIAQLLPESAEDVQLELITALDRFDAFIDIGREKCAHLLEHYAAVDLAGDDELSAENLAQLQAGPRHSKFEFETQPMNPPLPKSGQASSRKAQPRSDGIIGSLASTSIGALSSGNALHMQ